MPALPVVASVLRMDFKYTFGSDSRAMNRIFFHYSGSVSGADLTTLCTAAGTAWNTDMAPNCSNQLTLNFVGGTDLASVSGAQALVTSTHAGTSAAAYLGANAALVLRFKLARRYRGGHPRWYQAGLLQSQLSSPQVLTGGAAGGYLTSFAAMIAAIIAASPAGIGTLKHVNVSYYNGFTPVRNPITGRYRNVPNLRGTPAIDDVIAYSYNPRLASQRRRDQQRAS